ncbi:MAG: hypothetical protein CVV44_07310 [Spirochaetae bacterium HGW-Spirochaetae-1]|jgi:ABC-type lipoprotein release transport system permease subunit|nr:MAG: hypothetical protein CVV44_07310 [Spirochaetae bacterium HGW-Spirochaetae-1]
MMQRIYLIIKELLSGRFISLIVFFAITTSVFTAGFFTVTGNAFNKYINTRFSSAIPPQTIKVSPPERKNLLFFRFGRTGAPFLDDRGLGKIKKISGVTGIYPVLTAHVPMQARISLFGLNYQIDLLALGVPYALVKDDMPLAGDRALWNRKLFDVEIPVLLSDSILQAYNDGMAEPNGLPRISREQAMGLRFNLYFGQSSIRRLEKPVSLSAKVAGFTGSMNTLALILPLQAVRHYNNHFAEDKERDREYLYAFVKTRDHASLLSASSQLKKMGYTVETERNISQQIVNLKNNVQAVIDILLYLILGLAALAVSFSTMIAVMNRIEYYRIMRIVGASKIFITTTILIKYLVLGGAGAWCGITLLKTLGAMVTAGIPLPGLSITFMLDRDTLNRAVMAGTLIPVLSTIPALVRLYAVALSRD